MVNYADILCTVCRKQRAQKLCKRCPAPGRFCLMCWTNTHAQKTDHGEPKTLCLECFLAPAKVECEACHGKICQGCIASHMAACGCSSSEDDHSDASEDEVSERGRSESPPPRPSAESSDFMDLASRKPANGQTASKKPSLAPSTTGTKQPAKKSKGASKPAAKPAAKRQPKEPKKVAEVVEDQATAASGRKIEVSENVMSKIRKALALGLHCGGNEAEKKHAMQRATRMLQEHGLTQADVEDMSGSGVEEASGMTKVRLNGVHLQFAGWASTLGWVASVMTNTKWFKTKGAKGGACFTLTFYGLKADAAMAASIYEVAYNSVVHLCGKEMKGKGARANLDYKQGMASGLHKIADDDKKEREKTLEAARAAAEAAANLPDTAAKPHIKPEPSPAAPLGAKSLNATIKPEVKVKPEIKPDPDGPLDSHLDDDGMPWAKVKPERGVEFDPVWGFGHPPRRLNPFGDYSDSDHGGGGDDWDDVGSDRGRSSDDDWNTGGGAGGYGNKENGPAKHARASEKGGSGPSAPVETEKAKKGAEKAGGEAKMQQLILYDDKAKLAFQAVEDKIKITKGRKRKRQIKDLDAYNKGKKSASKVNLGVKALPGCV